MTCARPSPAEHIEATQIVFFGFPVSGADGPKDMEKRTLTFKVLRAYKGVESDTLNITYQNDHGASMGWGFRNSTATLVFARTWKESGKELNGLTYCDMITYHGRPNLHAEYWDILAGLDSIRP